MATNKGDRKSWIDFILKIAVVFLSALVAVNVFRTCDRTEDEPVVEHHTDTLVVYKRDTIIEEITRLVNEKVIDTIYLDTTSKNAFKLPITQRFYKDDDYSLWISGYRPNLDSLVIYPQTKTEYITNTITQRERYKGYSLYLDGGAMFYDKNMVSPSLGLRLTTPSFLSLGVEVAYLNGKVGCGINVGFKIFQTK